MKIKYNKCINCGNQINYGYTRCKSCAMKYNWKSGKYSERKNKGINNPNYKTGYFCTENYCKCGKKISSATIAYGNKRCHSCSNKGNLNGSYIDGRNQKWKIVRNQCFERDHYTCSLCNTAGAYLQAHHIIHRKNCRDIYDINNLITLCKKCHGEMTRIEFSSEYLFYKQKFINYIENEKHS